MKGIITLTVIGLLSTGCASSAPVFSWYHPDGGEYLFAFDKNECESQVLQAGQALSSQTTGPFFTCMHDRGYYLVNAQGIVQVPPTDTFGPQVSQQ